MKKLLLLLVLVVCSFAFTSFNETNNEFKRVRYSLNQNAWKFHKADVKNAHKLSFNDQDWLDITIPHDFNGGVDGVNNDVFTGRFDFDLDPDKRNMYKGPAWYRTEFEVGEEFKGKRVFINFDAVSLEANVWVNGEKVGNHQGGYAAFSFDVTDYVKFGKPNVLAVKADNTNNPAIAPWMADEKQPFPFSFDYAIYGGIYRDVFLSISDEVKIEQVLNTPVCGGAAAAVLTMNTTVKNFSKNEKTVIITSVVYNPKGEEVTTLRRKKVIAAGETVVVQQSETSVGDLYYWSPEHPQIYKVKSTLTYEGNEIDQYESIFGFRYYSLANNQPFMLNGKKSFIRGINRHQDMEGVGYALNNQQHRIDAELIKNAGFNFVRHAHYPCSQEFAKAAAEIGLMLWLEIPLTGSTSADPRFLENTRSQMSEMVEQYYNNPAVIIWGIGNESDRSGSSEAVSNAVFDNLTKLANKLDPNRLVTGCNFRYKSNEDLVNIYAPQDWTGWYHGTLAEFNPKKLIGEYGSDIDLNIRTNETYELDKDYSAGGKPEFWSQEYGSLLHEYKVSVAESLKDSFPGQFVWVAFDFASPRLDRGSNPVPYMNQKGLIAHDHKTKKDIYYFYQSTYRTADEYPMLYIVPGTWTNNAEHAKDASIYTYSNCDSVCIYNGSMAMPLGTKTKDAGPRGDTRFQWDNVEVDGDMIIAEGWFNNQVVVRDTVIIK